MSFSFILSSNGNSNTSNFLTGDNNHNNNDAETAGSLALLFDGINDEESNGFDAFGGKDIFGNPDYSSLNESFFANAGNTETAGSIASTETAGSLACAGAGDCSAASASVGGDCGSFSSVC